MKGTLIIIFASLVFSASAAPFDPPEIEGWEQDGDIKVFDRDNLFDHINGASEFYFSYNFKKLWVVRYSKGDAEISLEVYDQGDPVHAYGIYSMERPPESDVSDIGAQGYYEENILNFVADRYYVKMQAYHEPDAGSGVLLDMAEDLTHQITDQPELPEMIEALPEKNLKENSREYVSNTFMGLDFLGSAFRGTYSNDKGEITLFVLERESADDVQKILEQYLEFADEEPGSIDEGDYKLEDPFNGTIHLHWTGNYLIGFSGDDVKDLRSELLQKMKEELGR
ncbi:MAG: DUF6599 family protein [Marinilabilia sp.]